MNKQDEKRFEQLTRDLDELKAVVARQAQPPPSAESVTAPLNRTASRRGLLRLAGTGAAAAGLAAATGLLNATPVAAANGDPILAGGTFTETGTTVINNTTAGGQGLDVHATGPGSQAVHGVSAVGNGVGGSTDSGIGVTGGAAFTGTGVSGFSASGYGGTFQSGSGVDLYLKGAGRFQQILFGPFGPPTTGAYNRGEQIRDGAGDLYLCTNSGTPGTWRKVVTGAPGFNATSGSINFLSAPIRLLDTRPGQPAASGGGGPFAANSNNDLQVGAVSFNGITIPGGAIGVVGNVTVTGTAAGGFLTLYPAGAPKPLSSSLNYGPGQTINNATVVGLNADTSKLTIYTLAVTDVIFDAVGFMY